MTGNDKNRAYWKKNLQYLGTLLAVWFIVSYGCAILFVNHLDKIKIGGFRLRFLVCTTRVNLCFCCVNFHLCVPDEPP